MAVIVNNSTEGQTAGTAEQRQDSPPTVVPDVLDEVLVVSKRDRVSNPTSISDFLARNQVTGFAKTNRFLVLFNGLTKIFGNFGNEDLKNYLTYRCESVDFPGRELSVTDNRIYGPVYKTPTISTYSDVSMTLLCDSSLSQKQLFEEWMNFINPNTSFDFEYRDFYACDIEIQQINELNDPMHVIVLRNAYPTSVASLQSNWADDNYHKLQVTFSYEYWQSGINSVQDSSSYNSLQSEHEDRVGNVDINTLSQISRIDEVEEHRKRVLRAADNSTSNFKGIIAGLQVPEARLPGEE